MSTTTVMMDVYEAVHKPTGGARIHRRACVEGGAGARAVRRGLVAVRIEHPAVEHRNIYVLTGAPLAELKTR